MESISEQCFCLRWNNYNESVVSVFRRLLDEAAFLDVTLASEGRSIQAHRVILAACSPLFRKLLMETNTENPIIVFRDTKFWELEAIIDFIYNGQVNIVADQLPGFIKTAEILQVKGLAAVNNNNNLESLFMKPPQGFTFVPPFNNNIKAENLSMKFNGTTDFNYNNLATNNNISKTAKYMESSSIQLPDSGGTLDHHHVVSSAGLPSPPDIDSPPPPLHLTSSSPMTPCKKRRLYSPSSFSSSRSVPDATSSDDRPMDCSTPCPAEGSNSTPSPDGSSLKGSSPFSINETLHSLALSAGHPASAITSVAKAISFSKLVHEISSKATIASLQSASLPTPHPLSSDGGWEDGSPTVTDSSKASTPPPQPAPHINTKDWAANKNEDGFPECSLCGKVFKHQGSLVAHYQVHQQRTKCPVCQKVLSRHYHMKVHLLTVHKVPDSEIDSLLRSQCPV